MKKILINALLVMTACFAGALSARASEKEVVLKTSDGWSIHGTLSQPDAAQGRAPAVLLVPSFDHDQNAYGQYLYAGLAQTLAAKGVASLRIDIRGRGLSTGEKELHSFSKAELSKMYLDVQAALGFLSAEPGIDGSRLAIVAEGRSADSAVLGWGGASQVRAMTLISGRLSEGAKKELAASPDLPLFLIVSKEDREGFRDMADAYKTAESQESFISVYNNLGVGTTMFSVWRADHPKEPIEDGIVDWTVSQLQAAGRTEAVTFDTEDGWNIHGTLWTPATATPPKAGVVLVHSSFTDRHIFDRLAQLMVSRGLAVLNLDTRGRGESNGKGDFLNLPNDVREKGYIDVKAAVSYLISHAGVEKVGVLGTDRGASYALASGIGNPKVGALVLMTTLLTKEETADIGKLEIPIYYIASHDIEIAVKAMQDAFAVTKNPGSLMRVFDGGALGYEIFDFDSTLESQVADWMKDRLLK